VFDEDDVVKCTWNGRISDIGFETKEVEWERGLRGCREEMEKKRKRLFV